MEYTIDEIEALVLSKYKDQVSADCVEGPCSVGAYIICRVWTFDEKEDEYHAHYVVLEGKSAAIYEDFPPFALWLFKQFDVDNALERWLKVARTSVAAIILLGAMALVASLAEHQPDQGATIKYILTAVVGVAAGFLFGTSARPAKR